MKPFSKITFFFLLLISLLSLEFPGIVQAQQKPPVAFVKARYCTPTSGRNIRYVVIHTVEGSYEGCIRWFQSAKSEVSAHYVVARDGRITQMVSDKDKAWHSGTQKYNAEGIGIEHEGWAHKNTWTDLQYRASAKLTRYLCLQYNIPMDRAHIISHAQIAPKRRSDPGPYFDWDYYLKLVRGENAHRPITEETEKEREKLLEEAHRAAREGNDKEAYKKYQDLAYNYPESETAKKANARLEEYKKQIDLIMKLLEELEKEDQAEALKMAKKMAEEGRKKEAEFLANKISSTYPNSKYIKEFQNLLKALEKKSHKGAVGKLKGLQDSLK